MTRQFPLWVFVLLTPGCWSPSEDETSASAPAADHGLPALVDSSDPGQYRVYVWPGDWPPASDEAGAAMHEAFVARREGDRQIIVTDSASAFLGHEGMLGRTVLVFASHCGRNTAQLVNLTRPLAAIGHDAGIGLDGAGIQCITMADEIGLPAATVSADSAYIGVGMSLWETGTISVANQSAAALGVRVGISTREAASILLAGAAPLP